MYTVLIPTRNRPDRLKRLLTYLSDKKETSKIIIADGSDPEALSINQQTISELKIGTLQHLIPATQEQSQIFARIRTALSHVDTPLIAMIADDDFVLPDALREGSRFLAANPDFLAVTGQGVGCTLDGTGKIIETSVYQQTDCRGNSAVERLRAYGSIGTSVFYQLRRTSYLHALFDVVGDFTIPDDAPIFEAIDKLMSVASGKVAKLDRLFMVRELKSAISATSEVSLKGRLATVLAPNFPQNLSTMIAIGENFLIKEGVSKREAEGEIVQYISDYLRSSVFRARVSERQHIVSQIKERLFYLHPYNFPAWLSYRLSKDKWLTPAVRQHLISSDIEHLRSIKGYIDLYTK
jgi:glycosyltransferase domain-containing protein